MTNGNTKGIADRFSRRCYNNDTGIGASLMAELQVRQAALDDTCAISSLFRARIGVWQRLDANGRVEDKPYEALTIYERWLHGGAWMSIETAAIQLNELLSGAGISLV